jgi:hypothetical protein
VQIANLGSEMPAREEEPFEWDLEEGDDIEPEDHWHVGDLSGKVLPDDVVQEARMEELKFVDKIKLWEVEPRPAGVRVIPTRWVDANKGDEADYAVCSRLVAQEIKHKGTAQQYFAAMPPLAALRLFFSLAVTVILPTIAKIYAKKTRCVMQFLDVKKAHFWAMAERILRVELPWEYKQLHGLKGDMVGRLLRTMCGMRDAASLWEKLVAKKMKYLGFKQGMCTPCAFWHPVRDIRTTVHGVKDPKNGP